MAVACKHSNEALFRLRPLRAIKLVLWTLAAYFLLSRGCRFAFDRQLGPITHIADYPGIREEAWEWDPELVAHFPAELPADTSGSAFHYQPGFLQGGSAMELRLHLPPADALAALQEHRSAAKQILPGDAELSRAAGNADMFPKYILHTFPSEEIVSTNGSALLPTDFQMLLLSSRPYQTNPISWNHGDAAGISVSTSRCEIIYWVEAW